MHRSDGDMKRNTEDETEDLERIDGGNAVSSPMLMPPPIGLPKPHPVEKFVPKMAKNKEFSVGTSNKLAVLKQPNTDSNINNCYVERTFVQKNKYSKPTKDVKCFVTKNTDIDNETKVLISNQITRKIYTTPLSATAKKSGERVGIEVTKPLQSSKSESGNGLKMNDSYFTKKKMVIDEIDVESLKPIRCSTPTPSVDGSTILAGHLDYSIDGNEDTNSTSENKTDESDNDDYDTDDGLKPVLEKMNIQSNKKKQNTTPKKSTYCNEWMKREEGVSTENSDPPPSLYNSTISFSDSLLDVTSVSRNMNAQKNAQSVPKSGRGIDVEKYKNTVFM